MSIQRNVCEVLSTLWVPWLAGSMGWPATALTFHCYIFCSI
jgi:hypothetical protein